MDRPDSELRLSRDLKRSSNCLILGAALFFLAANIFPIFAMTSPRSPVYQGLHVLAAKIAAQELRINSMTLRTGEERELAKIARGGLSAASEISVLMSAFAVRIFSVMAVLCAGLMLGAGLVLRRFVRGPSPRA